MKSESKRKLIYNILVLFSFIFIIFVFYSIGKLHEMINVIKVNSCDEYFCTELMHSDFVNGECYKRSVSTDYNGNNSYHIKNSCFNVYVPEIKTSFARFMVNTQLITATGSRIE